MMLKQTVEYPDRRAVFFPGDKKSAVQLGSYQEMVFHRNPKNKIAFNYKWDLPNPLKITDTISRQSYSGDTLSFETEVSLGGIDHRTLVVEHHKHQLLDKNDRSVLSIGMYCDYNAKSEYNVKAESYNLIRQRGRAWSLKSPTRFYGFPDEVVAYYQNAGFVQELNLIHENLFRSLYYLEPLRTRTERLYSWTGTVPESVGYFGENAIAAILAASQREISLGYKQRKEPFGKIIALKLKQMGLIDEFKVSRISDQRNEYEVKIRTRGSPDWVDLPDVGFGISQVLPVLVQCFYAPHNSIIIMEQPEIHLHPGAQAALADVMIDMINSREDGKERNIQLIIETHSEHFLRRLQRQIAEDKISKDQVSAYFADISKTPAKLEPLQIDEYGNILNWPEGFFGDEMGDIIKHSKAAMKKREASVKNQDALHD